MRMGELVERPPLALALRSQNSELKFKHFLNFLYNDLICAIHSFLEGTESRVLSEKAYKYACTTDNLTYQDVRARSAQNGCIGV